METILEKAVETRKKAWKVLNKTQEELQKTWEAEELRKATESVGRGLKMQTFREWFSENITPELKDSAHSTIIKEYTKAAWLRGRSELRHAIVGVRDRRDASNVVIESLKQDSRE